MAYTNFSGSIGSGFGLEISYSLKSQSIPNNNSVVHIIVRYRTLSGYWITYTANSSFSVTVNGQRRTASINPTIGSGQNKVLWEGDFTIPHDSNGNAKLSASASYNVNFSGVGSATSRTSGDLPQIKRSSTFTLTNANLGGNSTITINRQNSTFTHNISYSVGSLSGSIATGVGTSYSWTIPDIFGNQFPNTSSINGTVTVDTYSGSTKIGTTSKTITISAPTNTPSAPGLSISDENTKVSSILGSGNFLQLLSEISMNFTSASPNYGAGVSRYSLTVNDREYTAIDNKILPTTFYGNISYSGYYIDTRGNKSAVVSGTLNIIPYSLPVSDFKPIRTTANQAKVAITRNLRVRSVLVNGVEKNTMSIKVEFKPVSSTAWVLGTGAATTIGSGVLDTKGDMLLLSNTFSLTSQYNIRITVTDRFSSPVTTSLMLGTEVFVLDYTPNGIGVNGYKQKGNFQVWGDSYFEGNVYVNNNPIQQHRLTDNNGYIENDYYSDFNNHTKTGTYHKGIQNNTPIANAPSTIWGILQVYSASDGKHILQIYTEQDRPRRMFMRVRSNYVWYEWEEYVKSSHSNLVNTGWVSTGATGVNAKRVGDIVYVELYDVPIKKGNANISLGTLPSNMIPKNRMMFDMATWSVLQTESVKVQINGDGTMIVLWQSITANRTLTGQISFCV